MPKTLNPPRRPLRSVWLGAVLVAVLCAWAWRQSASPQQADRAAVRVLHAPKPATALPPAAMPRLALDLSGPGAQTDAWPASRPSPGPPPAEVQPRQLTATRLQWAEAFLHEVQLQPAARGGFVVQAVEPESRWQRLGLRSGDILYTLDTPAMAAIDEASMVALMQQTTIELDVYRAGTLLHLQLPIHRDAADEGPTDEPGRPAS